MKNKLRQSLITTSLTQKVLLGLALFAISSSTWSAALEEIVVTAQKRAENLQEVPLAISAFTADMLEKTGITTTDELSLSTPGLQMSRQIGASLPFMRGVGTTNSSPGDETSIATYIDGVYSPNTIANAFSFNNIERIEVLKGPQGTLFGRNATGGLIHVITKAPSHDASGSLEVSVGNYETTGLKLYATGGLTEHVAADVAVHYSHQSEGFGRNLITGNDVGLSETKAIRSKLLFEPNDDTSVTLSLSYSEDESDLGITNQLFPGGNLGADGLITFLGCTGAGGSPGVCAPIAVAAASTYTGGWHDISADVDSVYDNTSWGVALKVEHHLNLFDFMSLTAYQETDAMQLLDQDATPLPIINAELGTVQDTFTQEFQFTSSGDGDFSWILGLFYMDGSAGYEPFHLTGFGVPLFIPGAREVINSPSQSTKSYSAYFQGTYDFTDATRLTAGIRLTRDERELETYTTADFGGGFVVLDAGKIDESWTEPTWRVSLDHQLNDETLLYASLSRGFKSGVYNTASAAVTVAAGGPSDPVDPEVLDAIEVGIKADLFDNQLRLNTSIYHYEYKDIQILRIESGTTKLLNAAEAEINGFEAEMTWLASDRLTLNFGLSVIDSEYSKFPNAPFAIPTGFGGNAFISRDASGNKLIRTPDYTFNVGSVFYIPTEIGELTTSLHYYYNDGFFKNPDNQAKEDSYSVVNAQVSWLSPDQSWRVRVFAKNLFDEEYSYTGGNAQLGYLVSGAPPRTFGAAVEYNF